MTSCFLGILYGYTFPFLLLFPNFFTFFKNLIILKYADIDNLVMLENLEFWALFQNA